MDKVWTEDDIRIVLNEISKKMGVDCSDVPVVINNNLKRLKGRCWTKKVNIDGKTKIIGTKIELAGLLTNGSYAEKDVVYTIIHEYVHLYTNVTENKQCGHNKKFKQNCIKAGIVEDTYVPYDINKEEYRYIVSCKKCGSVWYRHRLAGGVVGYKKNYHCSKCKGKLDVKENINRIK